MRADTAYFEQKQKKIEEEILYQMAEDCRTVYEEYGHSAQAIVYADLDKYYAELQKPNNEPICETEDIATNDDVILVQCIKQYIEIYSADVSSLISLSRMIGIWCGGDSMTSTLKKELRECITLVDKKLRENRQPNIYNSNGNIQIGDNNQFDNK